MIRHKPLFNSWRFVELPELVLSESGNLPCSAIIAKGCMHSIGAAVEPAENKVGKDRSGKNKEKCSYYIRASKSSSPGTGSF